MNILGLISQLIGIKTLRLTPMFGLGPSFRAYPENLAPIFPFHPHFAFPYQRKQMKWEECDSFTTLVT